MELLRGKAGTPERNRFQTNDDDSCGINFPFFNYKLSHTHTLSLSLSALSLSLLLYISFSSFTG